MYDGTLLELKQLAANSNLIGLRRVLTSAINAIEMLRKMNEDLRRAAEINAAIKSHWNVVEKDGLPSEPGEYLVYVRCGIPSADTDILEMVDLDYVTTAYFDPATCLWNENQEYYNGNLACIDKTKCYYISHWADKPQPPKDDT